MTKNYKNLNTNSDFMLAVDLMDKQIPHDEIISLLKQDSITKKQIGALKLEKLTSKDDAKALIANLTGQDGKIREAVSLKIAELVSKPEYIKYFNDKAFYDVFFNAIIDINPHVCRNIITILPKLGSDFFEYFIPKLISKTQELTKITEQFDFQDGKYKINKEVFKLYWCLEAICALTDYIKLETIKPILLRTKSIEEYTIREKTAKILSSIEVDKELELAQKELAQDKNYYVRRF